MADSFDQNAQDVGLSLDVIEEEIEAGLPLHADRLALAFDCEEFFAGRNAAYIPRRESEEWRDYVKRPKRTSKITRKVVRTLAEGLYNPGPTRKVANGAAADSFLEDVYEKNHVNAVLKQADRQATLNGFCAIQAHVTGRPEKPILLYLWGAHEVVVWTWPDDPTEAWAVVTITRERRSKGSTQEQRVRYDAWSRDEHRVYRSKWQGMPMPQQFVQQQYRSLFGQPATFLIGESGEPAGSGKNPYGVLPFSFVHDELVVSDFYEGGIGQPLMECNAEVDRELSDLAQHTREFMDPDRFTRGVSPSWRREKRAGQWQALVPNKSTLEDGGVQPEAFLVQGKMATEEIWYNIQSYVNNTLEDLDVPLVAVRDDTNQHLSGIAIAAKYLPLLERTRARQPLFGVAETDLAEMVLMVAGSAYGKPELQAAAADLDLNLVWPIPRTPLTDTSADLHDKFELDEGIKSLVDVVAGRQGITHDQAKEQIQRVAEDNKWLATVLPPDPPPAPDTAPPQQDPSLTTTVNSDIQDAQKAELGGNH